MPIYKCTALFNNGQRGWSETFWRTPFNTPKEAANFPAIILGALMAIRHSSTSLYAVRASNPNVPGDEYLRTYNMNGTRSTDNENQDVQSTAALVRVITLNNHKGNVYLRGLADADVKMQIAGGPAPSDSLSLGIRNLENLLKADATFGMAYPKDRTAVGFGDVPIKRILPSPTNPAQTIIELDADLPNVNVPPAADGPQGILVRGVDQRVLPALNGFFRVAAVDHTLAKFTVWYRWRSNEQQFFPPRAYARPYQLFYSALSEFVFQRFTEHKTGGPTVRSRGRRRPVSSRR